MVEFNLASVSFRSVMEQFPSDCCSVEQRPPDAFPDRGWSYVKSTEREGEGTVDFEKVHLRISANF